MVTAVTMVTAAKITCGGHYLTFLVYYSVYCVRVIDNVLSLMVSYYITSLLYPYNIICYIVAALNSLKQIYTLIVFT